VKTIAIGSGSMADESIQRASMGLNIITTGFLPVPATSGGAMETLVQQLRSSSPCTAPTQRCPKSFFFALGNAPTKSRHSAAVRCRSSEEDFVVIYGGRISPGEGVHLLVALSCPPKRSWRAYHAFSGVLPSVSSS